MKKGKFIVFEGNEGTGKTTHITFASNLCNFMEYALNLNNSVINMTLIISTIMNIAPNRANLLL